MLIIYLLNFASLQVTRYAPFVLLNWMQDLSNYEVSFNINEYGEYLYIL